MKKQDIIVEAFLALLRAGLWEKEVRLVPYTPIDFNALYQLAEDQSVIGLVAAGLEHVVDVKITKPQALPFLKKVLSLESRNIAMNNFIGIMVNKMREEGITALLVKGQGIAQCYERPLWRASGDVDFFMNQDNYEKAKAFMIPLADNVELEDQGKKHIGMTIDSWSVELHGALRSGLTHRANRVIDIVQEDTIDHGNFILWRNEGVDIPIPGTDNNVVFIFSHILQHFFHGGIGLRQICDWCRLLWMSRKEVNLSLLESRIKEMRLMTEWKAFASLAVNYLGLEIEAMPFYEGSKANNRKAEKILSIIIKKGNFGHNIDSSYLRKTSPLKRKLITIWRQLKETLSFFSLFPIDAFRFLGFFIIDGIKRTQTTTTFTTNK